MSELATSITNLFKGDTSEDSDWLRLLISHELDRLPLPGQGATLDRWRALAAVAEFDLSLAKLYEGHTDALAILDELGARESGGAWCVWASESPHAKVFLDRREDGTVVLNGTKSWCSGAASADHALLTAWERDGAGPYLVEVELGQAALTVDAEKWKAVGMASSASLEVSLHGAVGSCVGDKGDYLSRAGFWQGGAGIAACWYGGARGIAKALLRATDKSNKTDPFKIAALGHVELALNETASVLRYCADWIDRNPKQDASKVALRARLSAERSAQLVLSSVGSALGATPFCRDEKFAKAAADLPVFIRQSHAEKDFVALGERVLDSTHAWAL